MALTIAEDFDKLAASNKIAPVLQTFDESKGVAGRVNSITSSGSPLMQTARTRAAQSSAKRGLLNSSIGAQAGEQAVIETATPIASADASLFQQQQLANQNASNSANTVNATNAIQAGAQGRTLMEQAKLEAARLAQNQGQFDTTTQIERDRMTQQQGQFDKTFGLEGQKLTQQQSQFDTTTGLRRDELAQNQGQFDANLSLEGQRLAQQQGQFDTTTGLKRDELAQQQGQFDTATAVDREKLAQQQAQFAADQVLRRDLAAMEAQYKNDIQSSANISQAWTQMMQGISQIQNNPELDGPAKDTLISNQMAAFQSFSSFWKKATGGTVDVSDLLNLGIGGSAGGGGQVPTGPIMQPTPGSGSNPFGIKEIVNNDLNDPNNPLNPNNQNG